MGPEKGPQSSQAIAHCGLGQAQLMAAWVTLLPQQDIEIDQ